MRQLARQVGFLNIGMVIDELIFYIKKAWSSGFPGRDYDPYSVPQAWKDALQKAVKAGKIPDIPVSKNTPGTNPVYPEGYSPTSSEVCSATYQCRAPGDIWDAPDGVFGTAFDDGPLPVCSPPYLRPNPEISHTMTEHDCTC